MTTRRAFLTTLATLCEADARLRGAHFGVWVIPVTERSNLEYACELYPQSGPECVGLDHKGPPIRFVRWPEEVHSSYSFCRACYMRLAEREGVNP